MIQRKDPWFVQTQSSTFWTVRYIAVSDTLECVVWNYINKAYRFCHVLVYGVPAIVFRRFRSLVQSVKAKGAIQSQEGRLQVGLIDDVHPFQARLSLIRLVNMTSVFQAKFITLAFDVPFALLWRKKKRHERVEDWRFGAYSYWASILNLMSEKDVGKLTFSKLLHICYSQIHTNWSKWKQNFLLSLLSGNTKVDSLWTHLEAMLLSLTLSGQYKRTFRVHNLHQVKACIKNIFFLMGNWMWFSIMLNGGNGRRKFSLSYA